MELAPLPRFKLSDYHPMPQRLLRPDGKPRRRTRADRRGWGPGWPNCQRNKIHRIEANRILSVRVRDEIADLVEYLMKASNALGYDMRRANEVDGYVGSFACRAIKRSDPPVASNHSWGLAIDQNAKSNPMRKTFRSTTPPDVVLMWESAGFYWGGRYPVPPWFYDAMHFEYMGRPEQAAQDLQNAREAYERLSGRQTLYPIQRLGDTTSEAMVRVLQFRLNQHGAALDEDGDYGPLTDKAVRAFQKANGLVVDGIVGPITWGELNDDPAPGEDDEPDPEEDE